MSKSIKKLLIGNEQNMNVRAYKWNAIAGILNAIQATVMLMVTTRVVGLNEAGMLTIAFAFGNLLIHVGKFGVRNYQITDIQNKYKFLHYFYLRVFTVSIMLLVSIIWVIRKYIIGVYSFEKCIIVFWICLLFSGDAFEDVFAGLYQKEGRLDIGAKIYVIRWCGILVLFASLMYITRSINMVMFICLTFSFSASVFLISNTIICFPIEKEHIKIKSLYKILEKCFPLFLMEFLNVYNNNAVKYIIDIRFTEKVQAEYGFVSMPVFAIGMLCSFFYQPQMVSLAALWKENNKKLFINKMKQQHIVWMIITFVGLVFSWFYGIPILSLLYATDLKGYKTILLVLMIGSSFYSLARYYTVILTVMREQRKTLFFYCLITISFVLIGNGVALKFNIIGVAILYTVNMFIIATGLLGITIRKLRTKN